MKQSVYDGLGVEPATRVYPKSQDALKAHEKLRMIYTTAQDENPSYIPPDPDAAWEGRDPEQPRFERTTNLGE